MPNLHNGSIHCNILRLDDYTDSVKSHMAGDHSSWRSKGTQRYSGVLWGCRTVELGGLLKLMGANLPAIYFLNGSIQWSKYDGDTLTGNPPNTLAHWKSEILGFGTAIQDSWAKKHGRLHLLLASSRCFFRQRPPAVPIPSQDHVEQHEILLLGRRDWAAPGQWLFFAIGFCSQLNSRMI